MVYHSPSVCSSPTALPPRFNLSSVQIFHDNDATWSQTKVRVLQKALVVLGHLLHAGLGAQHPPLDVVHLIARPQEAVQLRNRGRGAEATAHAALPTGGRETEGHLHLVLGPHPLGRLVLQHRPGLLLLPPAPLPAVFLGLDPAGLQDAVQLLLLRPLPLLRPPGIGLGPIGGQGPVVLLVLIAGNVPAGGREGLGQLPVFVVGRRRSSRCSSGSRRRGKGRVDRGVFSTRSIGLVVPSQLLARNPPHEGSAGSTPPNGGNLLDLDFAVFPLILVIVAGIAQIDGIRCGLTLGLGLGRLLGHQGRLGPAPDSLLATTTATAATAAVGIVLDAGAAAPATLVVIGIRIVGIVVVGIQIDADHLLLAARGRPLPTTAGGSSSS
mmetsp:Transcript_22645/g.53682  ORF Transcript_22645/g.53682 Transcript_22645/m.53682 type:complete len:381 (+) Transcript_22645:129-1271(+)